jgi:poly(A) polymerase
MAALGGEAYLVGGAVRNALLGADPGDIDLSTALLPGDVTRALEAAGLRAVPTGIEHGTVTAVSEGEGFEITTFRADIETFGRHAVVHFSADMAADAARRDFTMNALYADADGEIIDPLHGLPDLEARRVRFIGEAEERIREDYLRILRFFRFQAWYGRQEDGIDADGLAACAELADGIDRLARERIGHEMRRLLAAPDPAPATASMAAAGVLWRCLPGANAEALAPLVHFEGEARRAPDWRVRLAALGAEDPADALRLSRAETRALEAMTRARDDFAPPAVLAYRHGAEAAWAAVLAHALVAPPADWAATAREIGRGAAARLPLAAADLLRAGMSPGPAIGQALARAEAAWIASGFALDRNALLTHALEKGQQQ